MTIPIAASAEEPPSNASAVTTDASVVRQGKMDVHHPLRIGSDYYPKQSLKNHEQGLCAVAFYINADGSVPAAQLLRSSGYSRLDIACLESVMGIPLLPATVNGTPVARWSDFKLQWVIDQAHRPLQPFPGRSAVPRVADDQELQVGDKFYPEAARARHPRGYCVVHTTVSSNGTALNATITRSTGSAILDQACLAAVSAARFTPEFQNGAPVADSTDIAIYW